MQGKMSNAVFADELFLSLTTFIKRFSNINGTGR